MRRSPRPSTADTFCEGSAMNPGTTRGTNGTTTRRTVLAGAAALGAAAALPLVLPAGTAQAAAGDTVVDDAASLLTRWHTLLTGGPGLDLTDPQIAAAVARIGQAATTSAKGLDPSRTDGLFPDLTSTTLSNHVTTSFKRLATVATAWAVPGTPQYGDTALRDLLLAGVDWMLTNRYGPGHTRFDNDWDWEIGSALALNDATVLLHDALGAERLARITAAVLHYTPDPNLWRADRQIATGANRVWISTVVAVNAVLRDSGEDLARVRDALSDVEGSGANSVLAFNDASAAAEGTGEGFYSDGSFLQHYKHPYNGGYGKELLNNLSRLLNLLAGTAWTVTDPDLDNVRGWVDEGFDPLLARGDVMASVCGREIARPSKQGHVSAQTVIEAVVRLIPGFPGETADRFTALVKQWIAEDTYRDFLAVTDLASLVAARQVIASPVPARGPLVTHKQHPRMDKAAHHRPSFALGISAYSSRIYNYESIQNENLHAWHLSDGMVLLYTDDLGHYSEDYWPTIDPTRLPGTTVITGRPADAAGQRTTSTADWAGGAALPGTTLGAYGMELRAYGSSLHGLKSWFCLDDVIACVGSGITADAGTAETVVENRKLRDPKAALLVNGDAAPADTGWSAQLDEVRWLHVAGTGGYVFPEPVTLHGLREDRTATWREINLKYGTDTSVTRPYLTLWQDHGTAPSGAGYFWLQAPAASAERTRQWSSAPPVKLIADSTAVHAVRRCADGLLAANFWAAGTAQELTADGPASVLVRPEGKTVTVSLSDPTQLRSSVVLDLALRGLTVVSADPGVSAAPAGSGIRITADTRARHGATLHLTLKRS
ncbi:polysaccharide lyase 8 family protein [Streptomyces sp. NBC_01260]|uniref:polysaccharide lyase 8 family protein n=2 Tax=Streptomyces TaxID=1883 RepID=UPI0021A54216|nr:MULTISPECIES: polysaccharide lyase 8 family protein [unclassified Streptomyces]MCX4774732.1 polysaccharide lyase 8 family protein [Streptomyces sp. NBC_01285]